jgi:hypothetical protein
VESRSDGPDDADDGKTVSKNKTNHRTRMQSGKTVLCNKLFQQNIFFPCDCTNVDFGIWNGVECEVWRV